MTAAFKANDFDGGLKQFVAEIQRGLGPPKQSGPLVVGVRDHAGLFSTGAVAKADEVLKEIERQKSWQVVIETIIALDGKDIKDRALSTAKDLNIKGLYVLLSKNDHKVFVEPSRSAESVFTRQRADEIVNAITADFKSGNFDRGLTDAVAVIRKDAGLTTEPTAVALTTPAPAPVKEMVKQQVSEAKTPPALAPAVQEKKPEPVAVVPPPVTPRPPVREIPPVKKGGNMGLFLIVAALGILFVLWMLGKLFRGATRPTAPNQFTNQAPPQGYGPGVPQQPTYAPPAPPRPGAPYPPQPQPGYAPGPGYGPPQQGYPPQGYPQQGYPQPGYAPPQPRPGGGFISGALGGLGGAVVGNIIYDQFGRPHPHEGAPAGHAGVVPPVPPVPPGAPVAPVPPEHESYDPNAGAVGNWGTPAAPDSGASGDWGAPAAPDAGASGDWGAPAPEPDAGADWGSPAPEREPEPDAGGGGDWGGDSGGSSEPDTGGGGNW